MPIADEKLEDKGSFDVYAMMLILSAVIIAVAIYILNMESQLNWRSGENPNTEVAADPTRFNDDEAKFKDQIFVTASDEREYKILAGTEIQRSDKKPDWMKNKPVDTTPGVDNTEGVSEDHLRKYKDSYVNPVLTHDDPDRKADVPPTESSKTP